MYATVVEANGRMCRSAFFTHLDDAIGYADRHPGVVAVEHIGVGLIWKREVVNVNE